MGLARWLRRGHSSRRDPLAGARHVVVLGGGTGMSTALRGLKSRGVRITAIVSMADDGGSSGVLRERLGIPPVGDLRNCLIALADAEPTAGALLQHRIPTEPGSTRGHPVGNLLLAAAIAEEGGDLERGVERVHRILQVRGRVVPATSGATRLRGRTRSGVIIHGQAALARTRGIAGVELEPAEAAAAASAVEAIRTADLLVLGPGSLYTSVIPHLLVPGIRAALSRRRAPLVWVANVDEQEGETEGLDLEAHVAALYAHGGEGIIDAVLAAAPLRGRRREQIGTPLHPAYRDDQRLARA